jgi:hypothetical protein
MTIDPFVTALDALFNAPGSGAADYVTTFGIEAGIRIIRSRPTAEVTMGRGSFLADTDTIKVRRSDVPRPVIDDRLFIVEFDDDLEADAEHQYRLIAEPRLDNHALVWTCEVAQVA